MEKRKLTSSTSQSPSLMSWPPIVNATPTSAPGLVLPSVVNGDEETSRSPAPAAPEDQRVDRGATLLRPVDVLQVEDHRELVERQGQAAPEEDRRHAVDDLAVAELGEGDRACDRHQDDSGDHVVHVDSPDVAAAPTSRPSHPGVEPNERERDQEREEQEEQRLLVLVVDRRFVAGDEAEQVHRARVARRLPGRQPIPGLSSTPEGLSENPRTAGGGCELEPGDTVLG